MHENEIIDPERLSRLLIDAEWLEAPLTDGVSPLTVVDARSDNRPGTTSIQISPVTPRVFVAIGRTDGELRGACDVALDDDADGRSTLDEIATTCDVNPHAASALAQVLRTAERGDVAAALWRESVAYSMLLAGPEFTTWHKQQARDTSPIDERDPVILEDHGDCFDVVLNRPHLHNAYNAAMRDALATMLRALGRLEPFPQLRLRGNGPSFCSGGDLNEFGTTPNVVDAHFIRTSRAPGPLLAGFGPLATAQVHGACIGAGTELAAFCGRVEAAPDARFCLPEVRMGLVPGAGGTVSVTRRIGRQRAALLALTGRTIDAHTALDWGLVDAVVL